MTEVRDMTMETTVTQGSVACILDGAVDGYSAFTSTFDNGDTLFYCRRQRGGAWETCKGQLSYGPPPTITRLQTLRSSQGPGVAINWGDGESIIYCCLPADQVVLVENALSEIGNFLVAEQFLGEIAALGTGAKDAALDNLGATAAGKTLFKAANAAAARAFLALGSASLLNAGTATGNLVQLDGPARLPPLDGSQLTVLPGHDHAAMVLSGVAGGSNSKIVRYTSASTMTHAAKSDTIAQLMYVLARGSDGKLYGPGSRVPFGGVAAGSRYFLGTAGDITTVAPVPDGLNRLLAVGMGLDAGVLLFDPKVPIGG